jgi:hypothetical protein
VSAPPAFFALLLALGGAAPAAAQELESPAPALGALNARIVEVLRSYPTDGTHAYHWPKSGSWCGNTKDLHYRGALYAAGDPEKRAYCCGLTFEVFLEAYRLWCEAEKREFVLPGIADHEALTEFRKRWFGVGGETTTMQQALVQARLGTAIAKLDDAEPGDFVQLWRNNGSGHAVIFLGWERDPRTKVITALRYWSTQKSTNGIGERREAIGKGEKDIDRTRLHIARVGVRPKGQGGSGGADEERAETRRSEEARRRRSAEASIR